MSQSTNKKAIIVLAIFAGIVVGLVLASNFNIAQNGFADDESGAYSHSASEPIPEVNSDLESASRACGLQKYFRDVRKYF